MGQEEREKEPVSYQYYCRQCRTWSDVEKCPTCDTPGVVYKPSATLQTIAGVWDPEDGGFHIFNFDDLRNLATVVEELSEKLDQVLKLLQKAD